ncbi:MAG: 1-acyl-sn-glycerol-3-phosphate acyltransferase [Thioalkalivibrionaceae bacterium]
MFLIVIHLMVGLFQTWRLRSRPADLAQVRQAWYARALAIAGVHVTWHDIGSLPNGEVGSATSAETDAAIEGALSTGDGDSGLGDDDRTDSGQLLVSNHVSWLDIPILGMRFDPAFVAKAEIAKWPLIGWMSRYQRVLFLQRGAHQASAMADVLQAVILGRDDGLSRQAAIFPEATTSNGLQVFSFHARLFAPVIVTGAPVQPVAIGYRLEPGEAFSAAAFVDEVPLTKSLWTVLTRKQTHVGVYVLPRITPPYTSRDELARKAEKAIANALNVPVIRRTRRA